MASGIRRTPCESTGCDSTTDPDFSSISSSASLYSSQGRNIQASHSTPVEHGEPDQEKESIPDASLMPSTPVFDPLDKKPDSAFQGAPPAYDFENNVENYGGAVLHPMSLQDEVMAKLQPVKNLPLTALGERTLYELSLRLDPENLPAQNWKLMADYMGFNRFEIQKFGEQNLRTKAVIEAWMGYNGPHCVGELLDIIQFSMNRVDVITDIPDMILEDARRYWNRARRSISGNPPSRSTSVTSFTGQSYSSIPGPFSAIAGVQEETYSEKSPLDNLSRPVQVDNVASSSTAQRYDAFVLCNMADKDFVVNEFLPKVEDEAKLKLCLADRDIPPGNLNFVDQMDYMFSRSRKLVVILSDEFFKSKEHEWQANLAISQDPASKNQRIIPVKYRKLSTRNIFDFLGCCDRTRTMRDEWFWNKIIQGIKS